MKKFAVLSFSGGMDSSSLLLKLLAQGFYVTTISIDYGQKHKIELEKEYEWSLYLMTLWLHPEESKLVGWVQVAHYWLCPLGQAHLWQLFTTVPEEMGLKNWKQASDYLPWKINVPNWIEWNIFRLLISHHKFPILTSCCVVQIWLHRKALRWDVYFPRINQYQL